jgi:O-antigen ligase
MTSNSARFLAFIFLLVGPIAGLAPLGLAPLLHLAGLGCLIAYRIEHKRWPFVRTRVTVTLAALVLFAFASCFWSSAGVLAWEKFIELLALALSACIVPVTVKALSPTDKAKLGNFFLIGLGIGMAAFYGDLLLGKPFMSWHKQLADAPLNTYNRSDIALGLLLWPAAALLYRRGKKALGLVLLLAYTALTLLLLSHSAMVAMTLGLIALVASLYFLPLVDGALIAICVLGFIVSIPVAFTLYRHGLSADMALPFSFRHRVEIWNFTAGRILRHPLFGLGLEGSRAIPVGDLAPGFMPISHDRPPLHPHNIFLQLWLEFGIAGSMIAFAFMASVIAAAKTLPRPLANFTVATIAAALSVASFAFGIWQGWWLALLIFLPCLLFLTTDKIDEPSRHPPA